MSYYVVKPPERSFFSPRLALGVVLALLGLALVGGWAAARPFLLRVDGRMVVAPSGATVEDLRDRHKLRAASGRLLSVEGQVLRDEGGARPRASKNGHPVADAERLYPGDVVTSSVGADARESLVVTDVAIPFKTRYEGKGPLNELTALGAPGIRRVTMGAVSGIEVTSVVVSEPSDMVVRRTRPKGKVVALTFDDGPWPQQTNEVLDVLHDEGVEATFFLLGRQVKRFPGVTRRIIEDGHSIGSHSYDHKPFDRLSAGDVRKEIRRGQAAILQASGRKTSWLRPPYGAMDTQAWEQVRVMNARAVMWDVDSRDWTKPGAKRIAKTVLRDVRPGSVVLFHDGGGDRSQTIEALPQIISKLRKRGYTFVTVDDLDRMGTKVEASR